MLAALVGGMKCVVENMDIGGGGFWLRETSHWPARRTVKDMGFIGWKVGAEAWVGGGGTKRLMGCRTGGAGTAGIDVAPGNTPANLRDSY